jgi:peptidoglycan/LPS O-acetylase OafA/YrhL
MVDTESGGRVKVSAAQPAATGKSGVARFPQVDAMRAIAALSVVLFHTGMIGGIAQAGAAGPYVSHLNAGVTLFFVISGFLLYRPFVAARLAGGTPVRIGPYLARRALRILPAYWVALTALTVAFQLPGVFTGDWWRYYGLVQIYDPRTIDQGMGVAWTLCIEATFYLFLPVVDRLVARLSRLRPGRSTSGWADAVVLLTLSTISLAFVAIAYVNGAKGWETLNLLGTFDWFALGMAIAVLTVVRPYFGYWPAVAYWALAAAAFVAVTRLDGLQGETRLYIPLQHVGYGLVAVLLFLPAANTTGGLIGRALSHPALAWTGLVSYSIYLFHASLIAALRDRSGGTLLPGNDWISLTVVTLAVVIPVAALSYYLIEARAPRLIRTAIGRLSGLRRRPVLAAPAPATAEPE